MLTFGDVANISGCYGNQNAPICNMTGYDRVICTSYCHKRDAVREARRYLVLN